MSQRLDEGIKSRTAVVGVTGSGCMGLPLAVETAGMGLRVTDFDLNTRVVERVKAGESHIQDGSDR